MSAPSRLSTISRREAKRRLGIVAAYREAFAESRPEDMPATDAAIRRLRAIANGAEQPDERTQP